ncbi:hypothetical protein METBISCDRAFT_28583 [Metschnikowia bicuspidata]|uniref:Uncharacterized protein n=1 Tax=Metschnikowia bicuspidata TaxID=27322 RepID=A0A4P9Z8J5_9ASCO|nr:hypothetical protein METBISCDRAFT_28583 [Metschnikowia bicuspidata]
MAFLGRFGEQEPNAQQKLASELKKMKTARSSPRDYSLIGDVYAAVDLNSAAIQLGVTMFELKLIKMSSSTPRARRPSHSTAALKTDQSTTFLTGRRLHEDLLHVRASVSEGTSLDQNLHEHTLRYFDQTVVSMRTPRTQLAVRARLYSGVEMPLFDPGDAPMDLLGYATSHTAVVRLRVDDGALSEQMGGRGTETCATIHAPRTTAVAQPPVDHMRADLADASFAHLPYTDISSRTCAEYYELSLHLDKLEYTMYAALRIAAPTPIYDFPFMVMEGFAWHGHKTRLHSASYYSTRVSPSTYVDWSVRGHTMCAFDTGLVQHVHRKRYCSDFTRLSWLLHRLDLRRDEASAWVDCEDIWLSYAVIDLLL